jgi:hypothetical protein
MAVRMVRVWHMGVAMRDRFMFVPMAVGAYRHGFVQMVMVPIVMPMCVNVCQRLVGVLMGMGFHKVQ